jgi:hypothetical protein
LNPLTDISGIYNGVTEVPDMKFNLKAWPTYIHAASFFKIIITNYRYLR